MNAGIRVYGVAEVQRAFRQVDRALAKDFGDDLKKAAEPVVRAAKAKEGHWQGASVGTIRARRQGVNVYVEQSARKVTGLRGDFGTLQLRRALEPALDENTNEVFNEVEHVLNKYADSAGF